MFNIPRGTDTKLYDTLNINKKANDNEIKKAYRKLALNYGVESHIVEFPKGKVQEPEAIAKLVKDKGVIKSGDIVLVVYGSIWKTPGLTNSLSIIHVK